MQADDISVLKLPMRARYWEIEICYSPVIGGNLSTVLRPGKCNAFKDVPSQCLRRYASEQASSSGLRETVQLECTLICGLIVLYVYQSCESSGLRTQDVPQETQSRARAC